MKLNNTSTFIRPKKLDPKGSSWTGHIPFVAWLIAELKPNIIVELGTHKGVSFLSFCQSVVENKLPTQVYAIDTWHGDQHAGYYGDDIYMDLEEYVSQNYMSFSHLMRMTFDEGVSKFKDRSIDLLHIDGLHTYEAVKHDFQTWLPKLSENSIVIFHDTFEKKEDFGVYKFWEEILKEYVGFEFKFWHGLGVLLVGKNKNKELLKLSENNGGNEEFKLMHSFFERLADALRIECERIILEENLKQEVDYAKSLESRIRGDEKSLEKFEETQKELVTNFNQKSEELKTLKIELMKKNYKVDETLKEIHEKTQESKEMKNILENIENSFSWKLTKSVRVLGNLLKGRGTKKNKEKFNEKWYLKSNPDVLKSGENAYEHYIHHGKSEGRRGTPETPFTILKKIKNKNMKISTILKKSYIIYRESGIKGLKEKIKNLDIQILSISTSYDKWIELYDTLSVEDMVEIKEEINNFSFNPLISIVMPTYNTNPKFLRQALDSIKDQIYENWELCIADDASTNKEVKQLLNEYKINDKRIKIIFRDKNGHISQASNSALEIVTGEYVALMDHDDLLPKHALYMVALEINRKKGNLDLIYTDEDKIDGDNKRYDPYFKMDWNSTLINSQNFVAHLGVYRTAILKKIGGFREGFEGSQDYDLLLRFLRETKEENIAHIPFILYHWRIFSGNHTFSTDNQNTSDNSAYKALNDHFEVLKEKVEILPIQNFPGCWRIKREKEKILPMVTLIIPTRDRVEILKNCINGILNETEYENLEIIIVDNNSKEEKTLEYFKEISENKKVRILKVAGEFNYSRLNNFAVKEANGEYLAFLNNDLEIIDKNWLKEMIYSALQEKVGAVGAKLYYRNNTVQHAGCVTGIYGVAGHIYKHQPKNSTGHFGRLILEHEVSVVTGACLVIPKDAFNEVNGFDEKELKVSYNDVDICLKLRLKGYKVIFNPFAELYHLESISRGNDETKEKRELNRYERRKMISRYGELLKYDPYYNVNLSLENENVELSFPPRIIKPWRDYIEFVCPFHRGDVLIGLQVANYYASLGRKVRFHVSENLLSWVKDFEPAFEVLGIPVGIPQAQETTKSFEESIRYVEKRSDFSGKLARSHPKMDFNFMGLNIVEHMLNELEVSIDSKLEQFKPKTYQKDSDFAENILGKFKGKTILIHPFGGWNLKKIPNDILKKIIEISKYEDIKLIQIGGINDEKIAGLDGWILENYSLGQWRAIFEKSHGLIGVDSWTSHFGAILGIKQVTLYGSTKARDVNIKKFFINQNSESIIFDSEKDCSPCHSLKCKYQKNYCLGYKINEEKILKFIRE